MVLPLENLQPALQLLPIVCLTVFVVSFLAAFIVLTSLLLDPRSGGGFNSRHRFSERTAIQWMWLNDFLLGKRFRLQRLIVIAGFIGCFAAAAVLGALVLLYGNKG